ncbi:alpha/beta-hydrolase [Annulohypoxylon maeteangense]|uniref:alpha/beta-hydrolase n=1 Tax=Annulohypoxylon maeteangense TaxID=1927788 RepID=UPI002008678B|nr:alpha/beta-hydrolase [Annulohypoxylon maeteangense]KAI0886368.1 alpha/beta-hydrolase [Annulohypoxylon maeteangense]
MAPNARPSPKQWLMGVEAFEKRMPHHTGVRALWETKWREPCRRSVYPFHDGAFEDFEPVFLDLIARDINDMNSAEFTLAFVPTAKALEKHADEAVAKGGSEVKKASDLYLRAACLLRIARFPYITGFPGISDTVKWEAWELQKAIYRKAGALWSPSPLIEVSIPHTYGQGRDGSVIPAYVRVPPDSSVKHPTVILLTGLDGYRPDNTARCEEFLSRGWAAVVFEIPGTADCPADSADPSSPDRLMDSAFSWMAQDGRFDMARVMCWGLSSGGYYAVRAAHTHREKLVGVVAHGAGTHHFFAREWLARADGHEYPFKLTPALAAKHGYGEDVEAYLSGAQKKFSLLETGVLELPSARLLLVNGMHDGLMPIEDSILLFEHGSPKEARFFTGALHMGYPMANSSVYPWMEQVMASTK